MCWMAMDNYRTRHAVNAVPTTATNCRSWFFTSVFNTFYYVSDRIKKNKERYVKRKEECYWNNQKPLNYMIKTIIYKYLKAKAIQYKSATI